MKNLLLLILVSLSYTTQAKNYYISQTGSNINNGLTPATAWQTIAKVNASFTVIVAGDSILFKCGDTFYGSVVIAKSGTSSLPIVISSYGTGAKPIISGFTTLSSWALVSTGIYQAAVNAKNTVNMVTLNNQPQAVGRYPNADAADGGYLTYTGFTGNTAYTCAALSGTNWSGAEVVAKKEGFILERDIITTQSGGTITYRGIASINPRNGVSLPTTPPSAGFGLFIQRDPRTLDKEGEWFFDTPAKKMKMFFGSTNPNLSIVKVSTIDTLINIGTKNYITISNLAFEGANVAAIYFADAGNIVIKNNTINYSGAKGIFGWASSNIVVDGNSIENSMVSAIDIIGRHAFNCKIINNFVKRTAVLPGMSSFFDDADCKAIYISVDSIALIRKNNVDSTGYSGIQFQGSGVTVDSNFVNYFCLVKDDGGGIYTFTSTRTKRIIKNNIILNGIGSKAGNKMPRHCEGIYSDGGARGIEILRNTVAFISNRGIYLNDPKDIKVEGNTVYSTANWSVNKHHNDSIYNFSFKKNIFFNTFTISDNGKTYANTGLNASTLPVAGNIQSALQLLGSIDSNYYQFVSATPYSWYYATKPGGSYTFPANVSFQSWQSYTGHDRGSVLFLNTTISTQRFEYNTSNTAKTITLDAKYVDVKNQVYNGTITLAPFTSAILIKSGPIDLGLKLTAGNDVALLLPTNATTLKSSANLTISTYQWTKIAGPAQFTIANSTSSTTAISNLTAGKYTFQLKAVTSTGDSALATVSVTASSGILPVRLIDFTAKNNNNKIALQWRVSSELNMSHYAIERSNDGKTFENIGELKSNNLADIQSNYSYLDNFALEGANYYRLVMVDFDGSFKYSNIALVPVKNANTLNLISMSLSIANSSIKINMNSGSRLIMNVAIVDVSGRILFTQPVQLEKGFNAISKIIPTFNTGVYYVKLLTNNEAITNAVLASY